MKGIMLVTILLLGACTKKSEPIDEHLKLTENLSASRYSNLYFSGQPSMNDFSELKEEGFTAIINLRSEGEESYSETQESKAVKDLGLSYEHVAFDKEGLLTDEIIEKITSKVVKHRKDGKVLVHCSSGNRVALWLGGHFYKDHKHSKKEAKAIAKKLGLKKEEAVKKLNEYLAEK